MKINNDKLLCLLAKYELPAPKFVSRYSWEAETSGIYFATEDAKIMYIGQSINIRERIRSHEHVGHSDAIAIVPVKPELMDTIERDLIAFVKPPRNVLHTGRNPKPPVLSTISDESYEPIDGTLHPRVEQLLELIVQARKEQFARRSSCP